MNSAGTRSTCPLLKIPGPRAPPGVLLLSLRHAPDRTWLNGTGHLARHYSLSTALSGRPVQAVRRRRSCTRGAWVAGRARSGSRSVAERAIGTAAIVAGLKGDTVSLGFEGEEPASYTILDAKLLDDGATVQLALG
jgi:hypothetical protein